MFSEVEDCRQSSEGGRRLVQSVWFLRHGLEAFSEPLQVEFLVCVQADGTQNDERSHVISMAQCVFEPNTQPFCSF
jgi:hypothetical protein